VWHRILKKTLPTVHFGETEFEAHGGIDAFHAFTNFAQHQGLLERHHLLVTTDGMWGGFQHIDKARAFIRSKLYSTRYAITNLASLGSRLDPEKLTVAMHVRLSDFDPSVRDSEAYRGRFNCALPMNWFMAIGDQLRVVFGARVQFQIFSDGDTTQLAPLTKLLNPVATNSPAPSDVSDLLAMSQADLLVCSISSYSLWAAALSTAPYVWFGPQMHRHEDGWASIWGSQTSQQRSNSPTLAAWESQKAAKPESPTGRGYAVDADGHLPITLLQSLHRRLADLDRRGDLVRCGVARVLSE
jgi:hypothetical protein